MKKMYLTRFLPCVLSLMLLPSLSACSKPGGSDNANSSNEIAAKKITLEQLKDYILVHQADAGEELTEAAANLQSALKKSLGVELKLTADDPSATSFEEHEILIGNCNRKEVGQYAKGIKANDWGYTIIENKLIIYGGSDETTLKAIQNFTKYIVRQHNEASTVFFDNVSDTMLEHGTYDIETLTLQGNDISEYAIVYPQENKNNEILANWLASRITESTGNRLTVTSDSSPADGKEILIGTTSRKECSYTSQTLEPGTYLIGTDDTRICARGADSIGDYHAVRSLIAALFENATAKQEVTLEASKVETVPSDTALTAMSFNIYVGTPSAQREISVLQTILNHLPDTLGVQEASPSWRTYLKEHLGDFYDSVGDGRDGGEDGEFNAIFYRRDRFELTESGTKWLSQTPNTISRFPDASLNRIFTYAILLDKQSNTEVMVVNTHLDHISPEVRSKQVAVLLNYLKKYADYPIVLTGDFNDNPASGMYQLITEQLSDSSEVARAAEKSHTFHNHGAASVRMDYIFVTPECIDVSDYRVITDKENGILPSDHYPVWIKYQITSKPDTPDKTDPSGQTGTSTPGSNGSGNTGTSTPGSNGSGNAGTSNNTPVSLTAMTFNVYVGTPTAQRETSVLMTIQKYMPDTLGVQEASPSWMTYLRENLGGTYDSVGEGRDGGNNGEYSAIFYRKDRFDLIESGTKWLSDSSNMVSKFPESSLNRIFTYAILSEKQSSRKVMVINTHLDHSGPAARDRQIAVILNFIKNHSEYPIIFTGDLNDTNTAAIYSAIKAQLADSSRVAQKAERSYTFHNYGEASALLDYIFVSRESIAVSYYKVITDKENGMLPSDHYPIYMEYQVTN